MEQARVALGRGVAWVLALALLLAAATGVRAQAEGFSALTRVDPGASFLRDAAGGGVALELALGQAVPWRLRLLADPPRLVADFAEVDFAPLGLADPAVALGRARGVVAVRAGPLRPGWSRLVLELAGPQRVALAGMRVDEASGTARLDLRLQPVSEAEFATLASPAEAALDDRLSGSAAAPPARRPRDPGAPLVVVLDPGHGGIDPGAERDGLREADLMLTFARELREALIRAGGFEVMLTRDADVFVSLEGRVRIARAAGADVFLSLHADALPDGGASGATVYVLADEATDAAAAALAERHDRADLLAGVDLTAQDDLIAEVLIALARTETAPRIDALADHMVTGIREAVGRMHRRPRQAAGFSVLKAPDIPSLLIELGFMSSPQDLAKLQDADWRARMAEGIVAGLQAWAADDAALAPLRRR